MGAELLEMHGTVLATASGTVGGGPTGNPGKVAGIIFWWIGIGGRMIGCGTAIAIRGIYGRCGIARRASVSTFKALFGGPQKVKYKQAYNRHKQDSL
jgi:hypothetical protein